MGKIVVKRFLDGKLLGAGAAIAIASWASKHNARVVSQSASYGWITVTFELIDKGSFESSFDLSDDSDSFTKTARGSLITSRRVTAEEQLEMARSHNKVESRPSKVTITYLDDPEGATSEKPRKKQWWKR